MSTQHTPGPWHAKPQCGLSGWVDVVSVTPDGREALPFAACKHFDEVANARLIAAAPDLLDALKAVLNNCLDSQGLADAYKQARAAIAKATGEQK